MTPEIWIRKDSVEGEFLARIVVQLNGKKVVIRLWDGSIDAYSYEELGNEFELFMDGDLLDNIITEAHKE